jgi:hypothetical protein
MQKSLSLTAVINRCSTVSRPGFSRHRILVPENFSAYCWNRLLETLRVSVWDLYGFANRFPYGSQIKQQDRKIFPIEGADYLPELSAAKWRGMGKLASDDKSQTTSRMRRFTL